MANEQDVLNKLNALHTDVAVTKTDVSYIKSNIDELKELNKTQQTQIDSLSSWRSYLTGAWAVVSGVLIWLATHVFRGIG